MGLSPNETPNPLETQSSQLAEGPGAFIFPGLSNFKHPEEFYGPVPVKHKGQSSYELYIGLEAWVSFVQLMSGACVQRDPTQYWIQGVEGWALL